MIEKSQDLGFFDDKTFEFRKMRNIYSNRNNHQSDIQTNLIGPNAMDSVPQRIDYSYINEADNFENKFQNLKNEIEQLSILHNNRLQANFSDNKTQDAQIEAKTQHIAQQLSSLRDDLRNLKTNSTNQTVKENLKSGLALKLRDITLLFRDRQANFIQNLKKQKEKASAFLDDFDNGENNLEDFDFDPGFTGEQTSMIVANELALRQRNQELQHMVSMMNQLNELFSDLGTIIVQQGTMLDRIDGLIEKSIEEVQSGNQHLRSAENHQKSGCYYYYLTIIVILILIFGTIIILKKK